MTYLNEVKFVGNFQNGMRNGVGRLIYPTDLSLYAMIQGSWKSDRLEQDKEIQITYKNGDFYQVNSNKYFK